MSVKSVGSLLMFVLIVGAGFSSPVQADDVAGTAVDAVAGQADATGTEVDGKAGEVVPAVASNVESVSSPAPEIPAVEASVIPEAVQAVVDGSGTAVAEAVPALIDAAAPVVEESAVSGDSVPGEAKESAFDKFPPQVKLSQWGPEIRINVIPDAQMGAESVAAVDSVKLETEKGEYLGLKTFQAEEATREAEFMINPDILKIEAVKLTVSSKKDGQWVHIQKLKDDEGAGPEAGKPDEIKPAAVAEASASAEAAPKKKGWLW